MSPLNTLARDITWCPVCQADCPVEIVALDGDPEPVAVCVECGIGLETWGESGGFSEAIVEERLGVRAS